jgi:hypothetical protein
VKAETAKALFRVGWVSQKLGDARAAFDQFRRAGELYQSLLERDPTDKENQRLAAVCWGAEGVALAVEERSDSRLRGAIAEEGD